MKILTFCVCNGLFWILTTRMEQFFRRPPEILSQIRRTMLWDEQRQTFLHSENKFILAWSCVPPGLPITSLLNLLCHCCDYLLFHVLFLQLSSPPPHSDWWWKNTRNGKTIFFLPINLQSELFPSLSSPSTVLMNDLPFIMLWAWPSIMQELHPLSPVQRCDPAHVPSPIINPC